MPRRAGLGRGPVADPIHFGPHGDLGFEQAWGSGGWDGRPELTCLDFSQNMLDKTPRPRTVSETPDAAVVVMRSIGGWNYGLRELDVTEDESKFFISLKNTRGGHEGMESLFLRRSDWERDSNSGECTCDIGRGFQYRRAAAQNAQEWYTLG